MAADLRVKFQERSAKFKLHGNHSLDQWITRDGRQTAIDRLLQTGNIRSIADLQRLNRQHKRQQGGNMLLGSIASVRKWLNLASRAQRVVALCDLLP
jgi:hypothetical protein